MQYLQIYDGNGGTNRTPAKGHLFSENSNVSLCGANKSNMVAPVFEKLYINISDVPLNHWDGNGKHCVKCCKIAYKKHDNTI